jgi:uncharacterized protein YdhG (YjbR/CyaY superfamily)
VPAKPKTIDDYLSTLSNDKRAALEKLRKDIKSAAPRAEECISYQLPSFRLDGKMLASFGAWTDHCAFYPGPFPIEDNEKDLKAYKTSKGTLQFPAEKPLPATLVRKLIKSGIAARAAKKLRATNKAGRSK